MATPENSPKAGARRDERGRFRKGGASPNPGGRPRLGPDELEVRMLARQHSRRAIERLRELMESSDPRAAAVACDKVLDRAYGRAPQALEVTARPSPAELAPVTPQAVLEAWKAAPPPPRLPPPTAAAPPPLPVRPPAAIPAPAPPREPELAPRAPRVQRDDEPVLDALPQPDGSYSVPQRPALPCVLGEESWRRAALDVEPASQEEIDKALAVFRK